MNILAVILAATAPMATRQAATNIAEHVVAEATPGIVATAVSNAVAAVPVPDYSTGNTQLVATIEATAPAPGNYAAVSNAAMTALHTETDPNVPSWAKASSAPLPPSYATVSNRAMTALQEHQPLANYYTKSQVDTSLATKANDNAVVKLTGSQSISGEKTFDAPAYFNWGLAAPSTIAVYGQDSSVRFEVDNIMTGDHVHFGVDDFGGSIGFGYTKNGSSYRVDLPERSGVLSVIDDIPDVSAIGDDATNYTDFVAGELSSSINQKYSKSSGDQLAQQVSAIGAHLNGEDARFVVTNYDSVVHEPEAYVEIKVSNDWLRVWDEGTRWNQYEVWKTNVDAELSYKADRAWGIYDSETGGYSPAGFTQVSSSNILIASGMAYQRTVTSAGAVWVLQCNQGVAQLGGDTNGYFKIMDSDGNSQFEVVKGDRREMGCDASGISLDTSASPNNVIIPYSVVSEEHPTLYITERLETPNWKAETDADCIGTVTWTGSSGAYVATVHPKLAYPSMFIRATYMVGGETYIKNNAPVKMDSIILNGTKYYLGTATIDGHTVLTLSTTAP